MLFCTDRAREKSCIASRWYFGSVLDLTTDIWNGAHGGCNRSAEDTHSSAAPDPTFAFAGRPCCPSLDFVIDFWIMIMIYTLLIWTMQLPAPDRWGLQNQNNVSVPYWISLSLIVSSWHNYWNMVAWNNALVNVSDIDRDYSVWHRFICNDTWRISMVKIKDIANLAHVHYKQNYQRIF
jgi:hypothetical protein